jgi:hypothetical protein
MFLFIGLHKREFASKCNFTSHLSCLLLLPPCFTFYYCRRRPWSLFIVVSVKAQNINMLCVVGTRVTRWSNNSGVDGLKQESLFEFGTNVELVLTLKTFYYKKRFWGPLKSN